LLVPVELVELSDLCVEIAIGSELDVSAVVIDAAWGGAYDIEDVEWISPSVS